MAKKNKSDAELRQDLEIKAAQRRAKEAMERAQQEAEEIERSKTVYENIWNDFAEDSKKGGKSLAYTNLKSNLAMAAPYLVPRMMTVKEHIAAIAECDKNIVGDGGVEGEDIRVVVEKWLSGEIELSRIPLLEPVVEKEMEEVADE